MAKKNNYSLNRLRVDDIDFPYYQKNLDQRIVCEICKNYPAVYPLIGQPKTCINCFCYGSGTAWHEGNNCNCKRD